MDALTLLTADHNRVRGLFARFKSAEESDDSTTMGELVTKIVEELEVHTTIEEEIFYPTVRDASEEVHDLVVEGIEEHRVAKELLAEVRSPQPGDDQWKAKVKVLIENVEHHAEEEESEMFPKIRSAMQGEPLTTLAEQLEERKRQLGAPTLDDKIGMTKSELMDKAREQEIRGRSKMSQEELAATVDPE